MKKAEIESAFTRNLLSIIEKRGLTEAGVSTGAGLNRRFVADLKVGHTKSPGLSNAYMIANFLGLDVSDIIEGRSEPAINPVLIEMLSQYGESDQERIVSAIQMIASGHQTK